jgi:hypothetical protein
MSILPGSQSVQSIIGAVENFQRKSFILLTYFRSTRSDMGLDREFKVFKWLEGGVCTMCAPGDQRKSSGNKSEQAEPNELQCQRRPMFRAAVISYARIGEVDRCPEFNSRNWAAMEWLLLGGGFIRQNGQVG